MLGIAFAVSVWYGSYSVLDVGKRGVPPLSPRQHAWLKLIRCSPGYAKRWNDLRFTVVRIPQTVLDTEQAPPGYVPLKVPLVVFDPDGWTPQFRWDGNFHIIGSDCRTYLDLVTGQLIGPVNEVCQKSAMNMGEPPPPVLEQSWFADHPRGVPQIPVQCDAPLQHRDTRPRKARI